MAARAQKGKIRIELTPEQQEPVRRALGIEVVALEFTPEQLEERRAARLAALLGVRAHFRR